MIVFFGVYNILSYTDTVCLGGGGYGKYHARQITLKDERSHRNKIVREVQDYYYAQDYPYACTKNDTILPSADGEWKIVNGDDGDIYFVISSYGHYARIIGTYGSISVLRRYPIPEFSGVNIGAGRQETPEEHKSINHIRVMDAGLRLETVGQTVSARTAIIRVNRNTDAIIRVRRSGYKSRFGCGAKAQVWYLVVMGGEFYAVPADEINDFFGNDLPWKTLGRDEFHAI